VVAIKTFFLKKVGCIKNLYIFNSYLANSYKIWLNLAIYDSHYFYIFHLDRKIHLGGGEKRIHLIFIFSIKIIGPQKETKQALLPLNW